MNEIATGSVPWGTSLQCRSARPSQIEPSVLHVRPAELRDFAAVRGLRESAADLPDALGGSLERVRFLEAAATVFAAGILDPEEFWIVADQGQGVIAWIHAGVRSDGDGVHGPRFTEVVMLYVLASERRHGIARALLAEVERRSRGRGIGLLRLVVHGSNAGAIHLYEELGYTAHGGMMEKRLGA
jgi:ribosomal protein S18 acetylase RimI-like enzyme